MLVRHDLPTGIVTLLFTDIEGSTRLLHELGAEAYEEALAEHRRLLREAFAPCGGVEVDTQGDAFFYAFSSAPEAIDAAGEGQQALSAGPIPVRMGVHTGRPHVGREGYVGETSTWRLGSPPPGTAARCSCRTRRDRLST